MDFLANLGAIGGGAVVGMVVFPRFMTWLAFFGALWFEHKSWQFAASASLFHSGPWTLVALAVLLSYAHAQPWFGWFIGGLGAMLVPLSLPLIRAIPLLRQFIREARNAA